MREVKKGDTIKLNGSVYHYEVLRVKGFNILIKNQLLNTTQTVDIMAVKMKHSKCRRISSPIFMKDILKLRRRMENDTNTLL